jgi:hypothetical protein
MRQLHAAISSYKPTCQVPIWFTLFRNGDYASKVASTKSSQIGSSSSAAPAHGSFTWLVLPFQLGYQPVCFGQKILGARLSQLGRMKL